MDSKDYYEYEYQDGVLKSLEDINESLGMTRSTDIAHSKALLELAKVGEDTNNSIKSMLEIVTDIKTDAEITKSASTDSLGHLHDISTGISALVNIVQSDDTETMKSASADSLGHLHDISTGIGTIISILKPDDAEDSKSFFERIFSKQKESESAEKIKDDKRTVKTTEIGFGSMLPFMTLIMSDKQLDKFDQNVDKYNLTIDKLIGKFDALAISLSKLETSLDTLDSISRIVNRGSDIIQQAGKQMLLMAISIGVVTSVMMFTDWATIAKGAVVFSGAIALMMGAMYLTSKFFKDKKEVDAVNDNMLSMSKSLLFLALGVAAFALVVTLIPMKTILTASLVMIGVAVGMALAAKIAGPASRDLGWAMGGAAVALMVFGLALVVFQELIQGIEFKTFFVAAASLLVLATAVKIIGMSGANVIKGAIVLASLAAILFALPHAIKQWDNVSISSMATPLFAMGAMIGLAALLGVLGSFKNNILFGLGALVGIGLTMVAMRYIIESYKDITLEDTLVPAMVMGGMLAGAAIMSAIGLMGPSILLSIVPLAALTGMMFLLAPILESYKDITLEDTLVPAMVMGGMLAATAIMSAIGLIGPLALIGIAPLAALTGMLFLLAPILESYSRFSTEDLAVPGLILGGMLAATGIVAAIGALGPLALIGIAVIAGVAGSLWIVSKALQNFAGVAKSMEGVDLDPATATRIVASVGILTAGLAVVGNPLTMPLLLAGIGATLAIAKGIDTLAGGLAKTESINLSVATSNAKSLIDWSKSTIKSLGSVSVKEVAKSTIAIKSLRTLGTTLALIASGMVSMANGTYTEYAIVNGEQVPVAVHQIGPETYKKYGNAVDSLLSSISSPIEKIGRTGNMLFSTDFERGLKSLRNLPDIVAPMVLIAQNADTVKVADYTGFAIAVGNLIDSIKKPIEAIGSGSTRFWSNDFESGVKVLSKLDVIVIPMIEIAKNADTVKVADYTGFAIAVGNLIDSIKKPIEAIGSGSTFFWSNDFESGIKVLADLDSIVLPMIEIAKNADTVKVADYTGFAIAVGNLIDNIQKPIETIGKGSKLFRSSDFEKGVKVLSKLNTIVAPMIEIANSTEQLSSMDYHKIGEQFGGFLFSIVDPLETVAGSKVDKGLKKLKDLDKLVGPMSQVSDMLVNFEKNKQVETLLEVAYAMEMLSNISLPKISAMKESMTAELYKKLDKIIDGIGSMDENQKKTISSIGGINLKSEPTVMNRVTTETVNMNPFQVEVGEEIDMAKIYFVLTEIYNKISIKR